MPTLQGRFVDLPLTAHLSDDELTIALNTKPSHPWSAACGREPKVRACILGAIVRGVGADKHMTRPQDSPSKRRGSKEKRTSARQTRIPFRATVKSQHVGLRIFATTKFWCPRRIRTTRARRPRLIER